MRMHRHGALPLGAALWLHVAVAGCSAPASRPVEGPIAEQIEASLASGSEDFDHTAWDELLAGGTQDGWVDYIYFQQHRDELDAYLERIARAELAALAPAELEALLLNAYNALTVRSILEHPRVESIREIDGVWDTVTHRVGGYELTLDEIEHNLLRPFFKDPRIHFAVNCASASCAPLPAWAFEGEHLDSQLEERTRAFLSDPRNVRIENGTVYLSKYFDWYGSDFVTPGWDPSADSVLEFVARYARDDVAERLRSQQNLEIRYLDYDWSLNAVARLGRASAARTGFASS